jgi:hypothetical protein
LDPRKTWHVHNEESYNLALDLRSNNPPNSSENLNGDRSLWNTIWSANVPPQIKDIYLEVSY